MFQSNLGILAIVSACGLAAIATVESVVDDAEDKPQIVRVLSYNIHHGVGGGAGDGKLDLERQARIIKELKPDLVALQEVDRKTRRSQQVDQAARLGELTGLHAIFGKAMDYDGGEYGLAILSAYPIMASRVHALPTERRREPRALLEATITLGKDGRRLRFFATHLCHESADLRRKQMQAILDAAGNADELMILAGDLNDGPESEPLKMLAKEWHDGGGESPKPTYPAHKPNARLDYVFYRPGKRFRLVEARVVDEPAASDHRPVLCVLDILTK